MKNVKSVAIDSQGTVHTAFETESANDRIKDIADIARKYMKQLNFVSYLIIMANDPGDPDEIGGLLATIAEKGLAEIEKYLEDGGVAA